MIIKNQFTWNAFLIGIFLLFGSNVLFAQNLAINAYVNRTQIGLDEQFELTVELTGSDANKAPQPDLPDIEDFAAFIGTSSSQNIQIVNGQMSVSKIYTHIFVATKEGKFQIPPIRLEFKGNTYTSSAIPIEIVKSRTPSPQKKPSNPQSANDSEDLSELLFLKATVNKRSVYQNEPVVITYKIYTAVNVTSYGISQLPNTVGFWSEEFPTSNRPRLYNEVVNGRQFRVAEIKKVALFPQGPGTKTLDPLKVDCEVQLPRQRRRRDIFDSFFDDPFFSRRSVRRTIRSNPINIDILPLPEQGRPPDFSGAVGNFALSASVDKNSVKTNEAITLKIKISGTGNIKILPKPKVEFPSDFEVYDPKIKENIKRTGYQISGSKTFEYVLIPRFPGNQIIKPISFAYFDLGTKTYKRISTKTIEISVTKGNDQFVSAPIGASKEDVKFIGQDIRFIQMHMPEFQKIGPIFYKRFPFYVFIIIPLLILASAWGYRKH
ncbi:MAG: BatD family protein, partial [bacterium]